MTEQVDGGEELKNILKTSLVPLECYFPGQIVSRDTDSVHSAITSVLRPFQHTAMLTLKKHKYVDTQKHTHNEFHAPPYITHTLVFTKIVIVIVRDEISSIFLSLT